MFRGKFDANFTDTSDSHTSPWTCGGGHKQSSRIPLNEECDPVDVSHGHMVADRTPTRKRPRHSFHLGCSAEAGCEVEHKELQELLELKRNVVELKRYVAAGSVPKRSFVVTIQQHWCDLLLDGVKDMEIRAWELRSWMVKPGERIYLTVAGKDPYVAVGAVTFVQNIGPLTKNEWKGNFERHLVPGDIPYGRGAENYKPGMRKTFAWEFKNPQWFPTPVPIKRPFGSLGCICFWTM